MKANYTHIDLWYGMGDRIFVWDYHTIIKRPIWFEWKKAHMNPGEMQVIPGPWSIRRGIFGFIGLHHVMWGGILPIESSPAATCCMDLPMVVSPMFCRLESPFCREPRIPPPPNFAGWTMFNIEGCLSHTFWAMDSGRCHASFRGFWIPFRRFFHGDSGSPKSP